MLHANIAKATANLNHYHKDGAMRFFTNDFGNPDAYYEPDQYGGLVDEGAAAQD